MPVCQCSVQRCPKQKEALSIEDAQLLNHKLKQEEIANVKAKKLAADGCIWELQPGIEMYSV